MKHTNFSMLVILIICFELKAQNDRDCIQIKTIENHLITNKGLTNFFKVNTLKFNIDPEITIIKGIYLFVGKYYAYKQGMTVDEFSKTDTSFRNKLFRENSKQKVLIDSLYKTDCLKKHIYKKTNAIVNIARVDSMTLQVFVDNRKRKYKGMYFIYIFNDENTLEKVFEIAFTDRLIYSL